MLPDGRTFYQFLEVSPNASEDVIRAAARALLKKYHPDRGGSHDEAVWLNQAKATLLNAARREAYDRELAARVGSAPDAGTTPGAGHTEYADPFHWQKQAAEEAIRIQAAERERQRRKAAEEEARQRREEEQLRRQREARAAELRERRAEREREANRAAAAEARYRRQLDEERHRLKVLSEHQIQIVTWRTRCNTSVAAGLFPLLLSFFIALTVFDPSFFLQYTSGLTQDDLLLGGSLLLFLYCTVVVGYGLSALHRLRDLERNPPVVEVQFGPPGR